MGQFDKHIKILGGNSRPDTFVGTWEGDNAGNNPSGTPVEISSTPAAAEKPGQNNGGAPMSPPKKISQRAARYAAMRLSTPRSKGGDLQPSRQNFPVDAEGNIKKWEPNSAPTSTPVEEPARPTNDPYREVDGQVKAKYNNPDNIYSTTLSLNPSTGEAVETGVRHNVPEVFEKIKGNFKGRYAGQPSKAEKDVIARPSRNKRPVPKPQTGKVIPNILLDNAGSEAVDTEQARRDAAVVRRERTGQIKPGPYGSQGTSAKPSVGGKTPERTLILAAKRNKRGSELAAQGKKMTTVHPAVLDLAKRIAKTRGMSDEQINSNETDFLGSEHVRDATVAHVFGVGHDELHKLHAYYGGKPLEANRRRAEAFKIADSAMRGNPEQYEGERQLLHSMIHTGSTVPQTLKNVRSGSQTDVTVNGMTPTLAENSNEGRASGQLAASKITAEHTEAPKKARRAPRGSVAAKPEAPLGTSGRVAVRQIGQKPEEAVVREFTPREKANKDSVPTADDSKSLVMSEPAKVESLDAIKEKEDTSKVLREEKDE